MKIGILGAGNIAGVVSKTLVQMKELECFAVASRSLEKAQAFAAQYGFKKAYGSYEEMVSDPDVELVYVATPHSHHFAHVMLALEHGKHVLCEKSFTVNAEQAEAIRTYAAERGLYVAEAIWTRYMPSRQMLREILESGVIGSVSTLTANLSYANSTKERISQPELAGGALLDLGVYGLNFALMQFDGNPDRVESSVMLTETGVDGAETITLMWNDGRMAVLTHSTFARSDRQGILHGDKGYIVVSNINNPQKISVYDTGDKLLACYDVPRQISGYEYEFLEAIRCIRSGKTESESMPMQETIRLMKLMDSLRNSWGICYPAETE